MKPIHIIGMIVCMGLLFFIPPVAAAETQWAFTSEDEGISTYRLAEADDAGMSTFKSIGFVNARLEVLMAVLRDVPSYAQWMEKCEESIELKHLDRNAKVFYLVLSMPVFKKNREVILETDTQYRLKEGAVAVNYTPSDKAAIPLKSGIVRLNTFSGTFLLEFFGRNKTRVYYTCTAPPDVVSPQHTAETIEGLREVARLKHYTEEGLTSPERRLVDRMIDSPAKIRRILKHRVSKYLNGAALLDTILNKKKLAAYVHTENSSFESIARAIAGIFYECLTNPTVKVYLSEKPLDAFLDIDSLLRQRWLGNAVFTREKELAKAFFENQNNVFYKAMRSEKAVHAVIEDKDLAKRILQEELLRRQLINDPVLTETILEELPEMETLADLEDIIDDRVDQLTD